MSGLASGKKPASRVLGGVVTEEEPPPLPWLFRRMRKVGCYKLRPVMDASGSSLNWRIPCSGSTNPPESTRIRLSTASVRIPKPHSRFQLVELRHLDGGFGFNGGGDMLHDRLQQRYHKYDELLSSAELNGDVRPCNEVGAGGVGSARGAALRWAAAVAASLGAEGLAKLPPSVATALLLPAVISADAAVKGIAEEHRELATEARSATLSGLGT